MGAEVIKIEGVSPMDHTREVGPYTDAAQDRNRSGYFSAVNAAKSSVSLQLSDPAQAALAREIAVSCDVVVESFLAGGMARFGLAYEALSASNPKLVMVSCSGFGRTGPMASHSAYMNTIAAFVGLTALNSSGGFPTPVGATFSDLVAGTSIAYAALLAVRRAKATGRGVHIDLSMAETSMALMGEPFMAHFAGQTVPSPSHVPRNVYRTKGDDKWIALSVRTDEQWEELVAAMGAPSWAGVELRTAHGRMTWRETIDVRISQWTRGFDNLELAERLQKVGVPAVPSSDPEDVVRNPHFRARGAMAPQDYDLEPGRIIPNLPWHFLAHPETNASVPPPPRLGEHNESVLGPLQGATAELLSALNLAAELAARGPGQP
jgi:crotonobetainyl-CoA:carnitine CoA-transferase CaiB-like acyl-CoA transferase